MNDDYDITPDVSLRDFIISLAVIAFIVGLMV